MLDKKWAEQLRKQELHASGMVLVARKLLKRGFRIRSLAREMELDPQIIASRGGREFHFAVRVARWPAMGELECDELRDELCNWAVRHEAACYLASVSVGPKRGTHRSAGRIRFTKLT